MSLRIPIVGEPKAKTPDWPIQPYVPRGADEYEKYNAKRPDEKK